MPGAPRLALWDLGKCQSLEDFRGNVCVLESRGQWDSGASCPFCSWLPLILSGPWPCRPAPFPHPVTATHVTAVWEPPLDAALLSFRHLNPHKTCEVFADEKTRTEGKVLWEGVSGLPRGTGVWVTQKGWQDGSHGPEPGAPACPHIPAGPELLPAAHPRKGSSLQHVT